MPEINAYNIRSNEKKLGLALAFFIAVVLATICFSPFSAAVRSWLNYLFVGGWLYLFIRHQRLKKVAYLEELRQFRLSIEKAEKRQHQRFPVGKDERIRVVFSVIKYVWLFEFRKKRYARIVDISKGGLLLHTDVKDIREGEKAAGIQIKFPGAGEIVTDGLIVRVTSDQCAVKFINITAPSKELIQNYFFQKTLTLSGGEGLA